MKNEAFKHFISWLLIASPLWWTCGCYTTREFTKLDGLERNELEIVATTKGSNVYTFTKHTVDTAGTKEGHASWKNPSYEKNRSNDMWSRLYGEKHIEGWSSPHLMNKKLSQYLM